MNEQEVLQVLGKVGAVITDRPTATSFTRPASTARRTSTRMRFIRTPRKRLASAVQSRNGSRTTTCK